MSIDQMLDSMDLEEYLSWQTFERIEPWGEKRADLRVALGFAALWNQQRGRNQAAIKPADLMPDFEPKQETEQVDWEARRQAFLGIAKGG